MTRSIFLMTVVLLAAIIDLAVSDCPQINPPTNFNIDKYIEKSWYVQKQQVTSYLEADSFFCVVATYSNKGRRQWFKKAITVQNYASTGGVNGKPLNQNIRGTASTDLCATQADPDKNPAKLAVAPCFLPAALAGPYWVAAFAENYTWAIVTGGQPTEKGSCSQGCTTNDSTQGGIISSLNGNDQGLWFFTRDRIASASTLEAMENKAKELGICTSKMRNVTHVGCKYENAAIKS